MIQLIQNNWAIILLAVLPIAEVIVRLTPTKSDDTVLNFVKKIFDLVIPNNKKGGGTFN
ncbi:MAG: hypothetical protein Q8K66_13155 [Sediminibacterium sp.]|nr:hypothetical protein [Sediminibacterium sp.]MDP3128817.1 hypothetical protein [Sediminibacterium sp.]